MKLLLLFIVFTSCATYEKVSNPELPINESFDSELVLNHYVNKSTLPWVAEAIKTANCIINEPNFHKEIIKNGKYEHFDGDNQEIVDSLKSDTRSEVGTYSKRFTKAIAYRIPNTKQIWLNRYKASSTSKKSKVNTLIHEHLHVLGYGHKGNSRYKFNNEESVPYKVGKIAESWFETCK